MGEVRIGQAAAGGHAVPFLRSLPLGTRIVVRRKENDGFHDALGDLAALEAEACIVDTRKGPVTVPLSLVTRVKTVPPPPPGRAPRLSTGPTGPTARTGPTGSSAPQEPLDRGPVSP